MPGIVGIITKRPRAWAEESVIKMLSTLRHESFYNCGTWADESLGVYVGWTSIAGSFSDVMPIESPDGMRTLIFSGEEYPGRNVTDAGYLMDGSSGTDFIEGLNGVFQGLLADCAANSVTLFNDRYGMQRICYHQSEDAFYFAAESKAILAVLPELRTADQRSLGEFAAFSCVLDDRTIFEKIRVVPAGSAWRFENGQLKDQRNYFHPKQWENQGVRDPEEFYKELRRAFSANIDRYFAGKQQVGMTLTGGLDTRVIMAWHKANAGTLPCYTFGGMLRDCHDVRIARRIAQASGQSHEVFTVGDDFLSRFPQYAERSIRLTEGSVDVYRAADLHVSERVRKLAPVKVVGTYGSEIVRHAVMFKPMKPPAGLYSSDFLKLMDTAADTYHTLRRQHPVTFAAFRQSPWYHSGILSLERSQLTVRSPFLDNDFVKAMYLAPLDLADDVRLRLIREGNARLAQIPTDRGIGGSALSRALLEFSFKAEYAYDYGMPQKVAQVDHALKPLRLERLFLGRHKLLHFRIWYRDQLANYVREMLLDPRTLSRPYLKRGTVEAVVRGHLKEGRNFTTQIHKILTLEILHRTFFDAA